MKKQELVSIIRKAVKEELSESLPLLLKEALSSNKIVKESKQKIDPVGLAKKALSSNKPQKQFTKNAAINKILNETVGGIPQEGGMVSNGMDQSDNFTNLNGENVNVEELPDHVSSALTRNYSDVLKLVEKKKGMK
tara:strand:+ start:1000 stop:1407 length:408 start_codon:yes stop_codon:yes gene_type:complete